ncbi:uncharacterized protein LTR77_004652 [Saxophila tyrrhenica]|uniref:Galactose oxidase n=1 Tax=Saxophila tyrrhenica TaxID=1690608 RepID=A0AAV9PGR0_9PEZI|nr:hypothetical protein LTR77_004652 [Saxophila tyrrhenica]
MAEAAAAAAVYETVETTAQIGVGAYMVAKPTMPLKATFTQIATSSDDQTKLSLSRSGHSISIVKDKAYIFGGETAAGKLASNEVHAVTLHSADTPEPDYSVIPAVPDQEGGKVPAARHSHAACGFNICVAVFGGVDESGNVIDEPFIWLFVTGKSCWETLEASSSEKSPQPRRDAHLFDHQNNLILYGGTDASGQSLHDVWHFSYVNKTWTQLPDAPVSTSNVALSDGVLYTITGSDEVSGDLHFLPLNAGSNQENGWSHVPFPTNPLTPGPQPRTGAGLLPVTTGYGRQYLLYMFGSRAIVQPKGSAAEQKETDDSTLEVEPKDPKDLSPQFWSDMWTYQLPSSTPELKANIYQALKPAKIKDAIRGALGMDDGKHSWGEVEVLPPSESDLATSDGKVHPGPRALFACDVMKDGKTAVIWGGVNPKGEREGDGWVIRLE